MKKIIILVFCLLIPMLVFGTGGGAKPSEPPAGTTETAEPGVAEFYNASDYGKKLEYKEAPMLEKMVASGEIEALKDRLPENPLVVKPNTEIGVYGGTLELIMPMNFRMDFVFEFLTQFTPDYQSKYPNVLESYEGNNDATKYTLHLRKGMRWSDGVPFTADDFIFWYESVAMNKELSPSVPGRFTISGKPGLMTKIDASTVECTFPEPYGLFIENLCRFRSDPYKPKHYLKQFHPDYVSKAKLDKLVKDEGFDSWIAMFNAKDGGWDSWKNPDRPTVSAWIPMNMPTDPVQKFVRNPYYFKVDTEGNQLPYIDELDCILVEVMEAKLLKTIAGEVDFVSGVYFGGDANYSLLMENREKGEYRLVSISNPEWYGACFGGAGFNYSHEDPVLKKLFLDKRFRIALSVAINRDEINNLIHKGQGKPSHLTVTPGPPFYGEKLFQDYLQYDVKLAKKMLDEIGLKTDADGNRLRSDGKRLRLSYHVANNVPDRMEIAELYRGYWKEIGIELINKPTSVDTFDALREGGQYDLISLGGGRGGYGAQNPLTVRATMPIDEGFTSAPQWGIWAGTNGEKGEEPPEDMKRIIELQRKALSVTDEAESLAMTKEILSIFEKNFWSFGGVASPRGSGFWVVGNRIGNAVRYPGMLVGGELNNGPAAAFFIRE